MEHKLITALLVCLMMLSTASFGATGSASASGSEDFTYEIVHDYNWYTDETVDSVTITGYNGAGGNVVIPSVIEGLPVTAIAEDAFYSIDTITSVVVPDSVTSIGYGAFMMCRSLTNATIGNGVTVLDGTFVLCFNLQNVTIGNNVTSICDNAFAYCYGLSSITIPASVTMIEVYSFQYCFDLGSMYFEGNAPVLEPNWDYMRTAVSSSAPLTAYFYHGATGFSTPSWNGIVSVMLPRAPSEPQDLMVRSGNGNATLSWTAPADDGGAKIDHYVVRMNGTEDFIVSTNTTVIANLTNGELYTFTVKAHNAAGYGPSSTEELAMPNNGTVTLFPPPTNDVDAPTDKVGTGSSTDELDVYRTESESNRDILMAAFGVIALAAVIAGFAVARQERHS
jgi:hypothetical protein